MAILKYKAKKAAIFLSLILLLTFCIFAFSTTSKAGESLQLYEEKIKAGMLYNFLKYTEWPQDNSHSTTTRSVCVFDNDPFSDYLKPMEGRSVNHRQIKIQIVQNINETNSCHMLVINVDEKDKWPEMQNFLKGKSILTVSDIHDFSQYGGIIEFSKKDEHIMVKFGMDAAKAAKLQVHERMLKLVTVVDSNQKNSEH